MENPVQPLPASGSPLRDAARRVKTFKPREKQGCSNLKSRLWRWLRWSSWVWPGWRKHTAGTVQCPSRRAGARWLLLRSQVRTCRIQKASRCMQSRPVAPPRACRCPADHPGRAPTGLTTWKTWVRRACASAPGQRRPALTKRAKIPAKIGHRINDLG